MPSPGAAAPPRSSIEDSYLELLADALEGLDTPARGQFLQRYFKVITRLDLGESQCVRLWDDALVRRRDLGQQLGRPVSLKTALMDVLTSSGILRVPVLIEYDELKKLEKNAVTDALTGLYNRRLFEENFEKELNRARRYTHPLSLVILDLHRFKEVNDQHGHPRGDDVLQAAAGTLLKTLRISDSAFRIGGDEFALLLPQTEAAQAIALSHRVGVAFSDALRALNLSINVGMDHGVATFPQDGDQVDALIGVADERLYLQKHANHVTSGGPSKQGASPAASAPAPTREANPTSDENVGERAERAAPAAPISIESKRGSEHVQAGFGVAASAAAAGLAKPPEALAAAKTYAVQRKAERVSMTGTNAYALLGDKSSRRARVLDLGFGGVALELDTPNDLPENLLAVLHVPILPPVRVNLRPVWKRQMSDNAYRVGCCFVS